jgi:NAD(P)-dependent dehydrogenase (short-subunit alcohol dehydrogenase family)
VVDLEGRTAIVTGGGAGIGRSEALALARAGAHVVVNDVASDGTGQRPAARVAEEIRGAGGSAEANFDDVSDWYGAQRLIAQAIDHDGELDVLVCNAGIVRDRTLVNMSADEWDAVVKVHLGGHFGPMHFAAAHWRARSKAAGAPVYGRIIATSSEAGLFGHDGQINYSAAKAGIAAMAVVAGRELDRYGVTANAICPRARTGMTAGVVEGMAARPGEVDNWDPDAIPPFVTYLAGPESADINGQVFVVYGATVKRMQMWSPMAEIVSDQPWTDHELARRVPELGKGAPMTNRPFEEYQ